MELRHLRYFAALAECLNFTRAAERMHVTQSTLSHQIRQLEDEIGSPLFDRIGRRVLLTDAGETLLGYAAKALREVDQAVSELKQGSRALSGELRIGATHTSNIGFVPQCLAAFLVKHPAAKVSVDELAAESIGDRLADGTLDVGIAYQPRDAGILWFEPLHSEEMVLVVGTAHPLASRRRLRMVELHRQPLAMLPRLYSTRAMLDECFASCGAEPLISAEVNSISLMIDLVARTPLAAIVSTHALSRRDDICVIPLESPTPMRTPGLLWKRDACQSPAVKSFAKEVRKASLIRSQRGAS